MNIFFKKRGKPIKSKAAFFENINEIYKPLARLMREGVTGGKLPTSGMKETTSF